MGNASQSDRWIFSFQRTGRRDLSEPELAALLQLSKRLSAQRFYWGIGAVLCFCGFICGIVIGSSAIPLGWAIGVAAVVAFFWVLNLANRAEYRSLLYRRALRKRAVDIYTRAKRPVELVAPSDGAIPIDEKPQSQRRGHWETDEKFEERIAKDGGYQPGRFETPWDDSVLITIEGTIVTQIIDGGWEREFAD